MRYRRGPAGLRRRRLAVALLLIGLGLAATPVQAADPPHREMTHVELGAGPRSFWLFEPRDPRPTGRAPVVVFNHGWLSTNPAIYGAWVRHLVRHGHLVIFPRYQTDWATPAATFLPNALDAVRDALEVAETAPGRVRPDRSRFALIGHSAGGNLAAQMAAAAGEAGLPVPRVLICVTPGEVLPSTTPDLARIPAATTLLVLAAEEDLVVGDARARQIFRLTSRVPAERKTYVLLRSDRHGSPPLVADHFLCTAALPELDTGEGPARAAQLDAARVDALDTVVLWRLVDATLEAGFNRRDLDDSEPFLNVLRDVGTWSDGRPVRVPLYGDDLDALPRVLPSYGLRLVPWPTLPPPGDGPISSALDGLGRLMPDPIELPDVLALP